MNYVLLGYYAVSSCNSLLKFWDNLFVPTSRVKNPNHANVQIKFTEHYGATVINEICFYGTKYLH